MKPYIVARWKEADGAYQMNYGNRPRDGVGYTWMFGQEKENVDAIYNNDVYFCDTRQDAEALADLLIKRWPQHQFVVAQSTLVVQAKPIEVVKAKITDKGVLPF